MCVRGYPDYLVNKVLAEVKLTNRRSAFQQKALRVQSGIMPFATQYNPSVPNVKNFLMSKWHFTQNRPLLREIYRESPFVSYSKGKSLKDMYLLSLPTPCYLYATRTRGCTAVRANIRHGIKSTHRWPKRLITFILTGKGCNCKPQI